MKCLLTVMLSLLLFTACSSSETTEGQFTVAVIPKGTTHEFWKSVHAGAMKAQQELGEKGVQVQVIWQGPLKEDDREQQVQVVENFIGRRISGIVLAPLDARALVSPVESAGRAGVPVVIIDSDLDTQERLSYVATDNYSGGAHAAERMGALLGGTGRILMLRYQTGSASTEAREAGFLNTLREKYPDIVILSSEQHSGATRETAYQASQNLLNRFGRDVDGIFTPNESSTVGMLLALRDIGRAGGDITFVGFDASTQLVEALRAGDIQGLIVQNPMRMGYDGVMTLVRHLQGESVENHIDTGVMLVTPDNVEAPEIQELLHPPLERYLGA